MPPGSRRACPSWSFRPCFFLPAGPEEKEAPPPHRPGLFSGPSHREILSPWAASAGSPWFSPRGRSGPPTPTETGGGISFWRTGFSGRKERVSSGRPGVFPGPGPKPSCSATGTETDGRTSSRPGPSFTGGRVDPRLSSPWRTRGPFSPKKGRFSGRPRPGTGWRPSWTRTETEGRTWSWGDRRDYAFFSRTKTAGSATVLP